MFLEFGYAFVDFINSKAPNQSIYGRSRALSVQKSVHLNHNNGQADAHDLIPANSWFSGAIAWWSNDDFVTFESLPKSYAAYERLDKRRLQTINKPAC